MGSPRVVVVGGGAAGFFGAIACKETNPAASVILLEGGRQPLSKVRIAGGGRCNVTHDRPEPRELVRGYPRGGRALLGPFTRFGQRETVAWFTRRGVPLKAEADGRMFPTTDDSGTVIACLLDAANGAGVELRTSAAAKDVVAKDGGGFVVRLRSAEELHADRVLVATGGAPVGYRWAAALGHTVEPLVPSIFTFKVEDERLADLAGVSVQDARVRLDGAKESHDGPVLVTHWGLSGPAVLKASAWGARLLHDESYRVGLTIDWRPDLTEADVREALQQYKEENPRRTVLASEPFGLPHRLWRALALHACGKSGVTAAEGLKWADASKKLLASLTAEVHAGRYEVVGKGAFKEEFVTCGGVRLSEVDFSTMESRVLPGLHFAGEVLDIDGITGGFNFQSAWTTGRLAGVAMAAPLAAPHPTP